MSTVLVVTPLVVASWPLMSAAITAAVGTMGFAAAQNQGPQCGKSSTRKLAPRSSWKTARSWPARAGSGEQMIVGATASAPSSAAMRGAALKLCIEGSRSIQGRAETDWRDSSSGGSLSNTPTTGS